MVHTYVIIRKSWLINRSNTYVVACVCVKYSQSSLLKLPVCKRKIVIYYCVNLESLGNAKKMFY